MDREGGEERKRGVGRRKKERGAKRGKREGM